MRQLTRHESGLETVKSFVHSKDEDFGEMEYSDWCYAECKRLNTSAKREGSKDTYFIKENEEGISIWTTAGACKSTQDQDLDALRAKRDALGTRI